MTPSSNISTMIKFLDSCIAIYISKSRLWPAILIVLTPTLFSVNKLGKYSYFIIIGFVWGVYSFLFTFLSYHGLLLSVQWQVLYNHLSSFPLFLTFPSSFMSCILIDGCTICLCFTLTLILFKVCLLWWNSTISVNILTIYFYKESNESAVKVK